MSLQPVVGEGINVYHFPSQQHLPVQFGPYTLWLQENKNRDVFDTTTTRIVSEPAAIQQQSSTAAVPTFPYRGPSPPDLTYTYHPQAQEFVLRGFTANAQRPQPPQQPDTLNALQYQIALKELEKQGLETMMLREQMLKHPYKLKFTENVATLTEAQLACACCETTKKQHDEAMQVDEVRQCSDRKTLCDGTTQTDCVLIIVLPECMSDEDEDEDEDENEDENDDDSSSCYTLTDDEEPLSLCDMPVKPKAKPCKSCFRQKNSPSVKKRIRFNER